MDYSFEYNGDKYSVPKGKIFDCLHSIDSSCKLLTIANVFTDGDFLSAAKIMSIMGRFTGKEIDPIEASKIFLYKEGGAVEMYNAINGLIELLNPPSSYHPPESEEAGKGQAAE